MDRLTGDCVPEDAALATSEAAGGESVVWMTRGGKPLPTRTFEDTGEFVDWLAAERDRAERRLGFGSVTAPAFLDPLTGEDLA